MPPSATRVPFGIKALLGANFLHTVAFLGLYTFAGDQVFAISGRELDLGLLGLVIFVPVFFLSPLAGTVVDRFDRRVVYGGAMVVEFAVATALYLYVRSEPTATAPIFALISLYGVARAFASPASRAMPIDLAPPELLERIIPLKSLAFQAGVIVGPVAAGFLAAVAPELPYLMAMVLLGLAGGALFLVPKPPIEQLATQAGPAQAWRDAAEGVRYIAKNPILRGAITLDLFAVLLGGATALLPAIAEERLGVGEVGLGWLRAADGIGAATVSVGIAFRPFRRRLGRLLLITVAIFGVATIALGLTSSYVLAFAAILVLSGADAISVFIRSSLTPLATPDVMRGRVIAVENVFIGGSNELGALESGVAAQLLGLGPAIVTGGLGTLVVVALWWKFFPDLRDVDRFEDVLVAKN
jgi:MFS family permease